MKISLRAMLLLMLGISMACAVLFVMPNMLAVPLLILASLTILPALVVAGLVYSRGSVQAGFLGAAVTLAVPLPFSAYLALIAADELEQDRFSESLALSIKLVTGSMWVFAGAGGLIGAAIWRFGRDRAAATGSPDAADGKGNASSTDPAAFSQSASQQPSSAPE